MKKIIILLFILMSISSFTMEGEVLGTWITQQSKTKNQMIIEIYRTEAGKYSGKIVGMTQPVYTEGEFIGEEKMDLKNPNENLRNRKQIGIDFLSDLSYNIKKDKYEGGKMYVPAIGKTFHSYMKLQDDGTLLVKGSVDTGGLFGKKQIWTRYKK